MPNLKLKNLSPLLGVLLFGFAFFFLYKELKQFSLDDIGQFLADSGLFTLVLAAGFTAANYVVLGFYDVLSVRYAGLSLPLHKVLLSAFVAYAFSNNFGFSGLSGSAVRLRFYSIFGVETFKILQVIGFSMLTFWVGLVGTAGVSFMIAPPDQAQFPVLGGMPFRILGVLCIAVIVAYLAISAFRTKPVPLGKHEIPVPGPFLAMVQVPLSILDWILGAAVFFVLIPHNDNLGFLPFLSIFVLAMMAGLVSNIPAGLGVFDWVMLTWLSPFYSSELVFSILVLYRVIYLIVPLVLSLVLYGIHELFNIRELVKWMGRMVREASLDFLPTILSLLVFVCGTLLFLSASPVQQAGFHLGFGGMVPPWYAYFAHFLSSILGLVLMVFSLRLKHMDSGMHRLCVGICALALCLALIKGLEVQELIIGTITLLLLAGSRRLFCHNTRPAYKRGAVAWLVLVLASFGLTVWLGAFTSHGFNFPRELFWQSDIASESPLLIKTFLALACLGLFIAIAQILRPGRTVEDADSAEELALIQSILARHGKAYDHLALMGDKRFFLNKDKDSFIMYTISSRTWISLGDPVGAPEKLEELVWDFVSFCHDKGGRPVFYEVTKHHLDVYLALGLKAVKIGEEGLVNLAGFSLDNKERRRLRYYKNHLDKSGCEFTVIPREEVEPLLGELKAVSDAWLQGKNVREKKFSMGYFDPVYLCRFPMALIRHEGKIVAFANLLCSESRTEISADLMRFIPRKVDHVMDYLFTNILLYAKSAGYQHYNLGMAPLSGVRRTMHGALWNRLAGLLFDHGEYIYNFKGLRSFKDQFQPLWTPKFLVYHGGIGTPLTILSISSAISGGLKGTVKK